ncbi:MAG: M28 family peptidase [Kiritimatiellae bacterium]|nr:M28 family peptidase [Kiritimatiellia bacterium]MDD5521954.1 M28 family peptidase [Kiritimatiellia bacterium]
MQKKTFSISSSNLYRHLRKLAVDIGIRLAGSNNEKKAADYIADEFEKNGAEVSIETFPVQQRWVKKQKLWVNLGKNKWISFPCSLISSTPGTDNKILEAPLVFFEAPAEYQCRDLSFLKGKAVVHLGTHIESREAYRRLIKAGPLFILIVDVRFPGKQPLADGMLPSYTKDIGSVPMVNVAFMDAWRWKADGASRARLQVDGGMRPSTSQNVIATLPGSDPSAGTIYFGAHHDTQADSVGADDNASGSTGLIELTRVLACRPRKQTIRLISFGAEEQLSVGSAVYVRKHRQQLSKETGMMINLDSYGSLMGWNELICNGHPKLLQTVLPYFEKRGLFTEVISDILPYYDLFPFVVAGIPGVSLGRKNCICGRFFHHRPDDDMTRLSVPLMAELLQVVADIGGDLASVRKLPFPPGISSEQSEKVQRFWRDLYGGWNG